MNGLSGKTAIVTGGSSGIGQAIAVRLGREGVNVAVNFVGAVEGAETTREAIETGVERCMKEVHDAGVRALLVEADVSNEHEVEAMFKTVSVELGPVDFLVNNAGIQIAQDSDTPRGRRLRQGLGRQPARLVPLRTATVRHLLAEDRPGAIVNVSSVHQLIPKPKFLGYSVSKGGMQNLTRTLALEYAGRGSASMPSARVPPSRRSIGHGLTTPRNERW